MDELESLKAQRAKIVDRINEIECEQMRSAIEVAVRNCEGKTFAYRRNHYSLPKSKSDYWDVFYRCVGFCWTSDTMGAFFFENVQVDSYGRPKIELEVKYISNVAQLETLGVFGAQRCRPVEFARAKKLALALLEHPALAIKRERKR